MNITSFGKLFNLLKQLVDENQVTRPLISTPPQKPAFTPGKKDSLPLCSPESVGISSDMLYDYITELYNDESINIQNLLIYRNGKKLIDIGFDAWDSSIWKNTFSQCKSITGLAAGMLLEDGLLTPSSTVTDIFGKRMPPLVKLKFKDVTIGHLLTMSSRIMFDEAESVTTDDWVKGYLASSMYTDGGFRYNSLNSYMISAAVTELTGKTLSQFLDERLFAPLGITNYYWEKCPNGLDKAGWGLYILPHDMAKIGQLMLCNGIWEGKRILSEKYIKAATTTRITTPKDMGDFDYGCQIWTNDEKDCFLFNGMLGQNMLCYRGNGIIVVSNAGNGDTFQQNALFEITDRYLSGKFEDSLSENKRAEKRLRSYTAQLSRFSPKRERTVWDRMFRKRNIQKNWLSICGSYIPTSGNAPSVSLVPTMMQLIQNNYSKGLIGFSFDRDEKGFRLCFKERGEDISLHIGFDEPCVESIFPNDERLLVATTGHFAYNEDDILVLKVKVDFLEYPYSRLIKFFFIENKVRVCLDELPGRRLVDGYDIKTSVQNMPEWLTALTSQGVESVLSRIGDAFEAELWAKKE